MRSSMVQVRRVALALLFVSAMARPASADWLLTPYLGIVFNGATNAVNFTSLNNFDEAFEQRVSLGASSTWTGDVVGFEIDFNYSPNFFQVTAGPTDFRFLGVDASLTTLMGNLIIGGPASSGVRPYFAAGGGLMRSNASVDDLFDDLSTNELGVNVGGGVQIAFNERIALRGDVRYFRGLEQRDDDDPEEDDDFFDEDIGFENFDYWRAAVGVTFRLNR